MRAILAKYPLPTNSDLSVQAHHSYDIVHRGSRAHVQSPVTVNRQFGTFLEEPIFYDERHSTIDEAFHDTRRPTTVDRQLGTLLEQPVSYNERHLTIDAVFHDTRQPTTVDRQFGTILEQVVSCDERHLTTDEACHDTLLLQASDLSVIIGTPMETDLSRNLHIFIKPSMS